MLDSYKKYLPQPIRRAARELLHIPVIYYTQKTLFMHLKGQNHKVCTLPLLDDCKKYEDLFKKTEESFREILTPFISEFRQPLGKIYNGFFDSVDAETYYSIVRKYQPKLIIEIGSGHSTHFALDAIKKNGRGKIVSIDPEPRRKLSRDIEHIQSKVEDVNVDIFKGLRENDILFIDSSHTTEEATYHIKEILPNLGSGVVINHHDILYPYKVYDRNDPFVFGEPDVILNFYLENKDAYEMIISTSYVAYKNLELVKRLVPSFNWNTERRPGSLWTRKR